MPVMALFVGGPWDGRREQVEGSTNVLTAEPIAVTLRPEATTPTTDDLFKRVVYRIMPFAGNRARFIIYAEESLTADDVMGMLWDYYTPPK
jgi:hypothetical protein